VEETGCVESVYSAPPHEGGCLCSGDAPPPKVKPPQQEEARTEEDRPRHAESLSLDVTQVLQERG